LHYLLGLDDRFAFPNFYQVICPHTFLVTEDRWSGLMAFLLPEHRAYDNVKLDVKVPCEDEFAFCVSGFMTPYLTGVFPRRAAHYDQFLTFRNAEPRAIEEWKASFRLLLKKVTLKTGKPLILKSPPHTCRIKLLLELFPDAKFIHIHRDPLTVFQSSVHTFATGLPFGRLQRTDSFDWTERIIRQYREMYDAFFEERALVPAGHFHEVCFETLEREPVREMSRIYQSLSLPDFAQVEARVRQHVDSLSGYRKNMFPELVPFLRQRIADEWKRCFDEWAYPR
jgi:hypothetical protein